MPWSSNWRRKTSGLVVGLQGAAVPEGQVEVDDSTKDTEAWTDIGRNPKESDARKIFKNGKSVKFCLKCYQSGCLEMFIGGSDTLMMDFGGGGNQIEEWTGSEEVKTINSTRFLEK